MGSARMEARVDKLEERLHEVRGRVSLLDSKLETLVQQVEKREQRFDALEESLIELRDFLLKRAQEQSMVTQGEQAQREGKIDNRFDALDRAWERYQTLMEKDAKGKATEARSPWPEATMERSDVRSKQEQSKQLCGELMEESELVTNRKKIDKVWRMNEGWTADKKGAEFQKTNKEWKMGEFMADVVEDTQTDERLKKRNHREPRDGPDHKVEGWSGVLKESTRSNCIAHNIRSDTHHMGSIRSSVQQSNLTAQNQWIAQYIGLGGKPTHQTQTSIKAGGSIYLTKTIQSISTTSISPNTSSRAIPDANSSPTFDHIFPRQKSGFKAKLDLQLCYRCHETSAPHHRCRFQQFRLAHADRR